jgi:hypothetical protein
VRVALTVLLLALAAAGCSDNESPEPKAAAAAPATQPSKEPTKPPPKRDLAWLARLHKWELKIGRASDEVMSTAEAVRRGRKTRRALRRAARPVAACTRTLHNKVGEPRPTAYGASYDLFERTCQMLEEWAVEVIADPSAMQKEREAADLAGLADDDLQTSLRAFKELPRTGGTHPRSRIEPRLTRLVSSFVYRSPDPTYTGVEVRCWSKREWPRVKKELRSYTGIGDFEGFAYRETKISMSPRVCAALAKLLYKGSRPSSGREAFWATASVGVLSHEAQHLVEPGRSEAYTECLGMQNMRTVGRMLRLDGSYADFLAEAYWTYVYRYETRDYRTPACHDGGPLDSQPDSSVWP